MTTRLLSTVTALGFAMAARPTAVLAQAAAAAAPKPVPHEALSDTLLDRTVAWVQSFFQAEHGGNAIGHFVAAGLLIIAAILLRRVITHVIFAWLRRLAAKTTTTLDDKLFAAVETPAAWLVFIFLVFAGLRVLVLPAWAESWIGDGFDLAWVTVMFWGLLRALYAVVDHVGELGGETGLTLRHFTPLIKKSLGVVLVLLGALTIAHRLGINVGAFLAGLGIGGLAFALAAQDTIANFFGSLVVAMDHPFRVGDQVSIGAVEGMVEDIGLRSTRLRTGARTQIIIPNKTVASEVVTNFSRMPQRRVEQKIGLTYGTTPEKMQALLEDVRGILRGDPAVHQEFIAVNFAGYGDSSLDIQIIYFAADPDWKKHMELRERINLKIMHAVAARGLAFAFPTQTLHVEDEVARKLTGGKPPAPG
ncbi:MAG TPA: mechanosensitive ion channel family protein [Opitutaceae bacterium]|nr:mechanosensitive ion channel family protein [Opitutaceae bacterium]